MWTQQEAIDMCKKLELITPQFGLHVALTGGCLYKEGLRKDLDIVLYRIRQCETPDFVNMWKELLNHGIEYLCDYGFCIKANYGNKQIDFFWPESPDGEYDQAGII